MELQYWSVRRELQTIYALEVDKNSRGVNSGSDPYLEDWSHSNRAADQGNIGQLIPNASVDENALMG